MKLNIYEKRAIVKTYEADTYDLMFGTVEDVANAVNLDSLTSGTDAEIIKLVGNLVMNSLSTVKDLLKDVFDGITDEELKHTKIKEIATVMVDIVKFTIKQINLGDDGKNVTRG